jgi:hypothetical protein
MLVEARAEGFGRCFGAQRDEKVESRAEGVRAVPDIDQTSTGQAVLCLECHKESVPEAHLTVHRGTRQRGPVLSVFIDARGDVERASAGHGQCLWCHEKLATFQPTRSSQPDR